MSITALYKALIHANVPEDLAEKAVDDLPHAESLLTQAEFYNESKALRIDIEKCATKEQLDAKFDQLRNELKAALEKYATKEQQDTLKAALEKCATKEQLDKLKAALEKCATKEQLDQLRTELRSELKADSNEAQVHLIKWMVGLTLGSMFGIISVMIALFGT